MTRSYLVARTVEVTYAFIARGGIPLPKGKGATWHAPVLGKDDAKVFTNKTDATAYRNKMNKKLHAPPRGDSFYIDVSPYGDYYIFPIERGQ